MISNPRHGSPPRLMAHQPTRCSTTQESSIRVHRPDPVSKAIYLRLPYPARNGGLEQAFVEACDRDASVDAFCKVSEQKHTFARLRYTQEGLNVCNGNQIEDSRACDTGSGRWTRIEVPGLLNNG